MKAVPVAAHRFHTLGGDAELKLRRGEFRGKPHCTQHPERIIAEGDIRVLRGAYNSPFQIREAAERVHQGTEILFAQAECHSIDGEIPAQLVVGEAAVFHYGIAGFLAVTFLSRAHEFKLKPPVLYHCRTVSPEFAHIDFVTGLVLLRFNFLQPCSHLAREIHPAAFHHNVYVIAGTAKKAVSHITSYHIGLETIPFRHLRQYPEHGGSQIFSVILHILSLLNSLCKDVGLPGHFLGAHISAY